MRYILTLLCFSFTVSACALDFDSVSGDNTLMMDLARRQNETTVLQEMPLLDLLAERAATSGVIALDGTSFLAAIALDDNWDVYFQLSQAGSAANPGVWKEDALKNGATFKYPGGELKIKEENGLIAITDAKGNKVTVSSDELFDLLYAGSSSITFGETITYAVIRNFAPLSGSEGTITLRKGTDGFYYYSLTPDRQVVSAPRWLLAINGVLYGLKVTDTNAVFVSKHIETALKPFSRERQLKF